MIETNPSYYWIVGHFIFPAEVLSHDNIPADVAMDVVSGFKHGLEMFLRDPSIAAFYPRSSERAKNILGMVDKRFYAFASGQPVGNLKDLATALKTFVISVQDEMDRIPTFTLTAPGNLSVHALVKNASAGFGKDVLDLIDDFTKTEVDEAGICLACGRATACGFHILRSVELVAKGYVYAVHGNLPPLKNRNWGTYIDWLTNAQASDGVLEILRVLKTKRNPLMHPKDVLTDSEAVTIFCLCQSALESLCADIKSKSLEAKFEAAMIALPNV